MLHNKTFIFFKESKLIVSCDLDRLQIKQTPNKTNREDAKDARLRMEEREGDINIYHVKNFSQKFS